MFDIGWPEMLVIAVVLIVVVGPKDLPRMLRTFGKTTSNLRRMAGDFRKQFDEALKEAELDEVKSTFDSARKLNPAADIRKALNPMEKAASDVRAGLDGLMKPKTNEVPSADAQAKAVEPAKTGSTAGPGDAAVEKQAQPSQASAATARPQPASTAKPAGVAATAKQAAAKSSAAKSSAAKASAAKAPASRAAAVQSAAAKPAATGQAKAAPRKPAAAKKNTGASS